MQLAAGARGLTVATLAEAQAFAAAGFDDITWAFPLVLARLDEVVALARRIALRVVVESPQAAEALGAAARRAGLAVHAWLEVDSGHHRSGVDPEAPASLDLARRLAAEPGVVFDGLLTHAGQSYHARTREERAAVAERERATLVAFAARLDQSGVRVSGVSVGSTPGMSAVRSLDGVTEARPGNYVFYDFMQLAAGVCAAEDCAVTVLTSVVSHQSGAGHVVVTPAPWRSPRIPAPGTRRWREASVPCCAASPGTSWSPRWRCGRCHRSTGWSAGSVRRTSRAGFPSGRRSGSSPTIPASPSRCSTSTRWSAARRSWTAGRSAARARRRRPWRRRTGSLG
jgi:hypothetical protein